MMTVYSIDKEPPFKLNELRCFDAVVRLGSFQAAARALNRTHPAVFAAVARLEEQIGFPLFDRTGYRVELTRLGRLFRGRATILLREATDLGSFATQLRQEEEPVLRLVLGDLCPRPRVLPVLARFFAEHEHTQLHLDYEAVGGPAQRLREGIADLAFHRAEPSDLALEHIALGDVELIPVAGPGFFPPDVAVDPTPDRMHAYMQCVIRDTAAASAAQPEQHFLIEGAAQCSVPDHAMKKELILHGLAWGHLPGFMIEDELREGALVSLKGAAMPGLVETLAVIRRRDRPHGPVATRLWHHLAGTRLS